MYRIKHNSKYLNIFKYEDRDGYRDTNDGYAHHIYLWLHI